MARLPPPIGKQFGLLSVLCEVDGLPHRDGTLRRVRCLCACGKEKVVFLGNVTSGKTASCGCARRNTNRRIRTTHGDSRSRTTGRIAPEYRVWAHMKERCSNPNARGYENYGGRGIEVCARWAASYEAFLADMGRRPGSDFQIDRIDNDGDYEPGNCRWALFAQQCRNKRQNRLLEIDGRSLCLGDASKEFGIERRTVAARLRRGWTVERALRTPV